MSSVLSMVLVIIIVSLLLLLVVLLVLFLNYFGVYVEGVGSCSKDKMIIYVYRWE